MTTLNTPGPGENHGQDQDQDHGEDQEQGARVVSLDAAREHRTAPAGHGSPAAAGGGREDAETIVTTTTAEGGVPVDRPGEVVPRSARLAGPRKPLLPSWAVPGGGLRGAVRSWLRHAGYLAAFHALRSPKYTLRVLIYAPVGAVRTVGLLMRWASAEHGNYELRQAAATRGDADTWLKLDARRQRQARFRVPLLSAAAALTTAGALAVWAGAVPPPAAAAVLAVVVVAAARAGRPVGKPITDRVSVGERFIKLTAEMTRAALVTCGAGVKDPAAVKFVTDIGREHNGFLAQVALPPGVVATDVIDKRDRLAGGLRLPMDQVWPEQVKGEHPGRLNIYVADRPVSATRQPRWPLLTGGRTDYFKPFPYGFDVRMRPVSWALAERNSLFGGIPGSGKSLAARNVGLGAVLDPLVIPAISELKGSGDFDMFEPLCPQGLYISGADEAAIKATLGLVQWLHQECEQRPALVARYARQGLNTVKKVNRAMAEKDDRLRPILAILDELQEATTHPVIGKQITPLLTSVVKRARALGIHLILATQRLDAQSISKSITSNISNRAALAVPAQPETDMILGTSAYRAGARPTAFVPGEDAGWMVRAGFGPGFETIRAAYLDDAAATAICQRAAQLRHGTPEVEPVRGAPRSLLHDVAEVWPGGEESCWSETLVPRLRELDPGIYEGLSVETFGALMSAAGLPTTSLHRKVNGTGITRAGIRRAALDTALTTPGEHS